MMDGRGKSDGPVLPVKPPNKAGRPAAEAVEGRGLAKRNPHERNALRTPSRAGAPSALERVRQARGEAGDLQLPGLHAQLREDPGGEVHGAAANDAEDVATECL